MAKERKSSPRRRKKAVAKKKPDAQTRRRAKAKAAGAKPPKTGRPHQCTPKRIQLFAEMCELQATTKDAAEYAGIGERTATKWLERGRLALEACGIDPEDFPTDAEEIVADSDDPEVAAEVPFVRFRLQATRARAEGRRMLLSAWRNAAVGAVLYDEAGKPVGKVDQDWRAAQKLMAVRDPSGYADKHKHELTGAGGDPLQVQIMLPAEEDEP